MIILIKVKYDNKFLILKNVIIYNQLLLEY